MCPCLLRDLQFNEVNQVWTTDIAYIPMARRFMCLAVIMDWHSRCVLSWRLSNILEADFCMDALEGIEHRRARDIQHRPFVVSSPPRRSPRCC